MNITPPRSVLAMDHLRKVTPAFPFCSAGSRCCCLSMVARNRYAWLSPILRPLIISEHPQYHETWLPMKWGPLVGEDELGLVVGDVLPLVRQSVVFYPSSERSQANPGMYVVERTDGGPACRVTRETQQLKTQ